MKDKILVVYENNGEQRFILEAQEQFEYAVAHAVGMTVRLATEEEKKIYTLHTKQALR